MLTALTRFNWPRITLRAAALALTSSLLACSGSEPPAPEAHDSNSDTVQGLKNGSPDVANVKGLVELVAFDGRRCTGVMISSTTILTSARCLIPYMGGQLVKESAQVFKMYIAGWDHTQNRWRKRCVDIPQPSDDGTCPGIKPKDLYIFKSPLAANDPGSDLGIIHTTLYGWTADENNFADIYTEKLLPDSRVQFYGYGNTGTGTPSALNTGTMRVNIAFTNSLDLVADNSQSCPGDDGGVVTAPLAYPELRSKVIGLLSRPETSSCTATNGLEQVSLLNDKMAFIESINGPCVQLSDSQGRTYWRCYQMNDCSGFTGSDPRVWDGCRGSGCAGCSELLTGYPSYFNNHPNCSKNTTCGGTNYGRCSLNCPKPTDADRVVKLPLSYTTSSGGWTGVGSNMTDTSVTTKMSKASTGWQWLEFSLGGNKTISRARNYDDGGAWSVDSWYMQYWNGSAWIDAFGAAPADFFGWNDYFFTPVTTSKVRFYMKEADTIESCGVEVYGF